MKEQKQMKKTKEIKKHEGEYIHIRKPSIKRIGIFFSGILFSFLTFFSFKLLFYKWKYLGLDLLYNCKENCSQFASWIQLDICFNIVGTFILIFLSIFGLFNVYNQIVWKEFIKTFIFGLIGGLIIGLIIGLIGGLIIGLIGGLIFGLIFGLSFGLIGGLIFGLIIGLIGGLIIELFN